MIKYLARQDADLLVIGWALTTLFLALATVAIGGVAAWLRSVPMAIVAVVVFLAQLAPTVVLVMVSIHQKGGS